MATIRKRNNRWLARVRIKQGNAKPTDKAQTFATKREAEAWARDLEQRLTTRGGIHGLGPEQTTLAVALLDYAHMFSCTKKGVVAEINRINLYLLAVGLPLLKVSGRDNGIATLEERPAGERFATLSPEFARRRERLAASRPRTNDWRARLAALPLSRLTPVDFRQLSNAMLKDGYKSDTVRLELAMLRHLFNYARKEWKWVTLDNPLEKFDLPAPGQPRDRRLSADEEARLDAALRQCRNPWILPFVHFAIETAMRQGETLAICWRDVDLQQRHVKLQDSKSGPRLVPLTQRALAILQALPRVDGEDRVFPISESQFNNGWKKAKKRAGITDFREHDLRHEGASRYALRLKGNTFLLQKVTGHKSVKMLERYVNLGFDELLAQLDATEPPAAKVAAPEAQTEGHAALPSNVVLLRPRGTQEGGGATPPRTTHIASKRKQS